MPTPCRSAGSVPVSRSGPGPGGRRRPRLAPLPSLPAPITTLDAAADGANTVSQLIETGVPSCLAIEALVELACRSQRGADWKVMYNMMRHQLVSMRLLPAQSVQLDPLRHMYQKMFTSLFVTAHQASQPAPLTDQPLLRPAAGAAPSLSPSRYLSEFEELAVLGRGGFAVVCRCRSQVDQQEYAVKRIPFRYHSAAAAERTVREVAVFASLDHPNIVKYNTAWLEAAAPAAGGEYDQKTDLYSLGVVTYELFLPFGTAMERGLELQRLRDEGRCSADVARTWPDVAAAVLAMTAESPPLRPA
ncbi:eukaryotic translation initiation factor 2-alpha kinase 1-like [Pollicipes pollicipes]|uniref:eukaryotic translation initiation factor 2-alpha kinase 1-like n=1 Tax=Pollicipes pollicipes TaxID=41117 RepID=UPI001884D9F0|nr:eukaryotic translation initiation factor 2-alpha kinase 1-like [Pollicipes pollicipes]